MKVSELKKLLLDAGCYKVREGGRHEVWAKPNSKVTMAIPRHGSQELPKGTEYKIRKWAGV